jgi:hypothetical protein
MDNVKRGEVLQGQARKNTAAAFAFGFAVIAISSPPSGSLIRQNRQAIMAKSHTNAVRFRTQEIEKKST